MFSFECGKDGYKLSGKYIEEECDYSFYAKICFHNLEIIVNKTKLSVTGKYDLIEKKLCIESVFLSLCKTCLRLEADDNNLLEFKTKVCAETLKNLPKQITKNL